ncbi:MAG: SDR family oxidoreductase [Clostridium sp.]|nr:SDR family oxidoreductase [Clostridium sp.]
MVLDKFRLDGQIAVVTGASRGMGQAIAVALAEAGADIAAVSRHPNAELEETVNKLGRRYLHIAADLTQREQTKNVIPKAAAELGRVDILINNAGIIRRSAAIDYSEKDWDDTIEIDLNSAFILSQAAAKYMMERKYGKIISVASVLGFQGGMNVIAYSTAKHGIVGLTKALSNDWAKYGINVNAIAPSYIETDLTSALQKDKTRYESIRNRTPVGRWGKPEDLEGAALFLASPASDFVNGITLPVDGGWLGW